MRFGGRVRHFFNKWKTISSDQTLLDLIHGVSLEFTNLPSQRSCPKPYKFGEEEKVLISEEISSFFRRGIIEEAVECSGQIISNIFSRPKKSGKVRIILNLSKINKDIEYHKFKMDTVKSIIDMIRPGVYFASLDLTDAYYCINVKEEFRKYLRFTWEGKLWQFTCLPQGLSSSPRLFTKILKVAMSFLREQNIIISAYIDDLIILSRSIEQGLKQIEISIALLENLGFVINREKSVLIPSQRINHLGLCLDSIHMTVKVSQDKCSKMRQACNFLKSKICFIIREVAKVLGLMISYTPGVENGLLHYRKLESCKNWALKYNRFDYSKTMTISKEALKEVTWWEQNIESECTYLLKPPVTVVIATDSSIKAWGAIRDNISTGGNWTVEEQEEHINVLELKAIEFGLKSLCPEVENSHIRLKCDNTTAVAYVNAKGGSKSNKCNDVALNIWDYTLRHGNYISAEHVPGVDNAEADFESRNQKNNLEWMLDKKVFSEILCHFDVHPSIDLFASRINSQLENFVSWKPDPEAKYIDTFSHKFPDTIFYAFPPFSLINKFLKKVELEEMEGILIAPTWSSQNYFPFLLDLIIDLPLVLPWRKKLLVNPISRTAHPLGKRLRLAAFLLSTNPSKREDFLKKLLTSCYKGGGDPQLNSIVLTLRNGSLIVNDSIKVQLPHL